MAVTNFVIVRRDFEFDHATIETEEIRIGRDAGNDLVLNHRSVENSHASVCDVGGALWVFPLSSAGRLFVDRRPVSDFAGLAHNGVLSIGPFMLRFEKTDGGWRITVETTAGTPSHEEQLAEGVSPGVRPDRTALEVFWEKRRRESGRIVDPLRLAPTTTVRLGKLLANWMPTLDLRAPWRRSHLALGALAVFAASLFAVAGYRRAFSPGGVASPHVRAGLAIKSRPVATHPAAGDCSACHGWTGSVSQRCASCHRTPNFDPSISASHLREGMTCTSCHGEHGGADPGSGLSRTDGCSGCHLGGYLRRAGARAGQPLEDPHATGFGYPIGQAEWKWPGLPASRWKSMGLPEFFAARPPAEQFHAVHRALGLPGGDRTDCRVCHLPGIALDARVSLAASCTNCHASSGAIQGATRRGATCLTCHPAHGRSLEMAARLAAPGGSFSRMKDGGALTVAHVPAAAHEAPGLIGALSPLEWIGLFFALPMAALVVLTIESRRRKTQIERELATPGQAPVRAEGDAPRYPHPVIDPALCIGCHACIDACPHGVLDIVNGVAAPVALDQCMEDTSCMAECPTTPKACIVVNTVKKVPRRKVPTRDQRFMTNVPGIYLIGDVSGVPLIKNAVNEGAQVIREVVQDLNGDSGATASQYDVAIIGAGPAGLSATLAAHERGLRYIAIEQNQTASTLRGYPAGKHVFFKPDSVPIQGSLPLPGAGGLKEDLLGSWSGIVTREQLRIHEQRRCRAIEGSPTSGFRIETESTDGAGDERQTISARRVVLAIGNHGSPMRLGVPGEDPERVRYSLSNPALFLRHQCLVVGAGNSAIEAAVDLTGLQPDGAFAAAHPVTLVVRSDLKGDLKLGNKIKLYDCINAGRITAHFGATIAEIRSGEVTLSIARSGAPKAVVVPNDVIFALIGTERPVKFLESLGVRVTA